MHLKLDFALSTEKAQELEKRDREKERERVQQAVEVCVQQWQKSCLWI